jgi:hypothetical protein
MTCQVICSSLGPAHSDTVCICSPHVPEFSTVAPDDLLSRVASHENCEHGPDLYNDDPVHVLAVHPAPSGA